MCWHFTYQKSLQPIEASRNMKPKNLRPKKRSITGQKIYIRTTAHNSARKEPIDAKL